MLISNTIRMLWNCLKLLFITWFASVLPKKNATVGKCVAAPFVNFSSSHHLKKTKMRLDNIQAHFSCLRESISISEYM